MNSLVKLRSNCVASWDSNYPDERNTIVPGHYFYMGTRVCLAVHIRTMERVRRSQGSGGISTWCALAGVRSTESSVRSCGSGPALTFATFPLQVLGVTCYLGTAVSGAALAGPACWRTAGRGAGVCPHSGEHEAGSELSIRYILRPKILPPWGRTWLRRTPPGRGRGFRPSPGSGSWQHRVRHRSYMRDPGSASFSFCRAGAGAAQ